MRNSRGSSLFSGGPTGAGAAGPRVQVRDFPSCPTEIGSCQNSGLSTGNTSQNAQYGLIPWLSISIGSTNGRKLGYHGL